MPHLLLPGDSASSCLMRGNAPTAGGGSIQVKRPAKSSVELRHDGPEGRGPRRGAGNRRGDTFCDRSAVDRGWLDWCERISLQIGAAWRFCRVNQTVFQALKARDFEELLAESMDS